MGGRLGGGIVGGLLLAAILAISFITLNDFISASLSPQSILKAHSKVQVVETPADDTTSDVIPRANALTGDVRFDNYTLIVRGQRIFLHSGEFHTFRLPVPGLWPDILQKMKAAGLNGVSVYTHWGLINPSPGVIDLNAWRALQPLFDAAKDAGIFMTLRPGPYINSETSAGGLAHWVTSTISGQLRTNNTLWRAAWQDYITTMGDLVARNQVDQGGPIIAVQIENEYHQSCVGCPEYMQQLEDAYRARGVTVPFTYNDAGQQTNFVDGTGSVDIHGTDEYPNGFDCNNPTVWGPVPTNNHDFHENTNPSQPWFFPEFQGGSSDPWGPHSPGYANCRIKTGPDFQEVFYKSLWASNAKMINYYMLYGGTSWGGIPFEGVYTSYDYGASINESRELTTKHVELKRQSLFLRSSPEFYKTDWIGNSTTNQPPVSSSAGFANLLRNPDTSAGFIVVRQSSSTSTATIQFKVTASTSNGTVTIPQIANAITLAGRRSRVLVTDYALPSGKMRVLYSTASVMLAAEIGGRDVLLFYGDSSQEFEFAMQLTGNNGVRSASNVVRFTNSGDSNITIISTSGIQGLVTVWDSDQQLVLFADPDTAGTFFAPVIPAVQGDLVNFWSFGSNSTVLVGGPYLVRNATISGSELQLRGDLKENVQLKVVVSPSVKTITWNGAQVKMDANAGSSLTSRGGFVGQLNLRGAASQVATPTLGEWKFADSLPEIQKDFSDSDWVVADHTTTNISAKPLYGDGRVLYGCDYEYCENIVLWRGHFNGANQTSANLSVNGGTGFAASVWLNDVFVRTTFGNNSDNQNELFETNEKFIFPKGAVVNGDNVLTVVQDQMGMSEWSDQASGRSPRGIRGFSLDTGKFGEWRVQGKAGGYRNFPDKTRGLYNEGGLFGEREGWHLPGFDTSSWASRNLSDGLQGPGVGFFVTTFNLSMPADTDVPLTFVFQNQSQPYRLLMFVNGWMFGKLAANLGPQFEFPVQQGILNYAGVNTIAVALWVLESNATVSPRLSIRVGNVYEGGVGGVATDNPSWSSRG